MWKRFALITIWIKNAFGNCLFLVTYLQSILSKDIVFDNFYVKYVTKKTKSWFILKKLKAKLFAKELRRKTKLIFNNSQSTH